MPRWFGVGRRAGILASELEDLAVGTVALMGIDGTIRVQASRAYRRDAAAETIMAAVEDCADECFVGRKSSA
ncbi:hypothetical protein [Paenarthrobacter nicotinovorans]|uniref:hypothetical protein n=1 Tax=Paenarthrobacter nicotinovorans TaxID=29320 RepID=UPI00047A5D53